jgi:hypothetical protein
VFAWESVLATRFDEATDCKVERAMRAIAVDSFKVDGIDDLLIFFQEFGAAGHIYGSFSSDGT